MTGINLQVLPVEAIQKDVEHLFQAKVTYIIVGHTHGLVSILLWDCQLQFILILSSLINMPIQNPFSQTQLLPLPQILLQLIRHLFTHFHCFHFLFSIQVTTRLMVGSAFWALTQSATVIHTGRDSKIRELMAFSWLKFPLEHQGLPQQPWRLPQSLLPWYSHPMGF